MADEADPAEAEEVALEFLRGCLRRGKCLECGRLVRASLDAAVANGGDGDLYHGYPTCDLFREVMQTLDPSAEEGEATYVVVDGKGQG